MRTHGVRRRVVVNEAGGLEGLVAFDDVLEYVAQEAGSLVQLVANELALERKRHVEPAGAGPS